MDIPIAWVISPEPDTRRLVGLNLSKRGFRAVEISPLDKLVSSGARPHLIILDVDPLGESAWESVKLLRQSAKAQDVPLILLLSVAPTASQIASLQPVHWVKKPLAIDEFLALVRESVDDKGDEGNASQEAPM
jgi:DNA-binding response OmpR family regulator